MRFPPGPVQALRMAPFAGSVRRRRAKSAVASASRGWPHVVHLLPGAIQSMAVHADLTQVTADLSFHRVLSGWEQGETGDPVLV